MCANLILPEISHLKSHRLISVSLKCVCPEILEVPVHPAFIPNLILYPTESISPRKQRTCTINTFRKLDMGWNKATQNANVFLMKVSLGCQNEKLREPRVDSQNVEELHVI